jgi:hypothetical protein
VCVVVVVVLLRHAPVPRASYPYHRFLTHSHATPRHATPRHATPHHARTCATRAAPYPAPLRTHAGEEECTDVMVTAELQTGNDRTQITGPDGDKVSLKAGASYDTVQCSEVKEPGTHLCVNHNPTQQTIHTAGQLSTAPLSPPSHHHSRPPPSLNQMWDLMTTITAIGTATTTTITPSQLKVTRPPMGSLPTYLCLLHDPLRCAALHPDY